MIQLASASILTMGPRRVAAIDCGTNSIRLLILAAGDPPRELDRRLELVRLGQDVDATGVFHPDALRRTFAACDLYAKIIDSWAVDKVRFVATSAARDASNKEVFLRGVQERFGVPVEIISGDEEAKLSFAGAIGVVPNSGRTLVVDIGGGSTELIIGHMDQQIEAKESLNIGSVRITERFFHHDPATEIEIESARRFIGEQFDSSAMKLTGIDTVIGVAGTVTSMGAAALGLKVYDRKLVHGLWLSKAQIEQISAEWLSSSLAELVSRPGMHPLRAQVLPAGSLILVELLKRVQTEGIWVSETDMLDGIAQQLLAESV